MDPDGKFKPYYSFSKSTYMRDKPFDEQNYYGDAFGLPDFSPKAVQAAYAKLDTPLPSISENLHRAARSISLTFKIMHQRGFTIKPLTCVEFMITVQQLSHTATGIPHTYDDKVQAINHIGADIFYHFIVSQFVPLYLADKLLLKACLKDEIRALENGNKKPPRIFMSDNLITWGIGVILLTHTCDEMYGNNEILIGVNPWSGGWNELFNELRSEQEKLSLPDEWDCTDVSKNDTNFHSTFFMTYIASLFKVPPKWKQIWETYLHFLFHGKFVDDRGYVYSREKMLPSGVLATSLFTTLYVDYLKRCVFFHKGVKLSKLARWPHRVFGDDNIFAWPSSFGNFVDAWNDLIKPCTNQTLTIEHHTGLEHQPLLGSQILSLRFVREVNGLIVPVSERPNRCIARLNYRKKDQNDEQICLSLLYCYWYTSDLKQKVLRYISERIDENTARKIYLEVWHLINVEKPVSIEQVVGY